MNEKDKLNNENLDNTGNEESLNSEGNNDTNIVIEEDIISEDTLPEYEDDLSTSLEIEDIKNLNENEAYLLSQKIDIELEQYEDIYMRGEEEGKTFEEIENDGYNEKEYLRLKELNKAIFKHIKALRKMNQDNSFFAVTPLPFFLIFIAVVLLTMYPVSPFLPLKLLDAFSSLITLLFTNYTVGAVIFIILYHLIFIGAEFLVLLILVKKRKKREGNDKKLKNFRDLRNFLVLIIINSIVIIIPIIILIYSVCK